MGKQSRKRRERRQEQPAPAVVFFGRDGQPVPDEENAALLDLLEGDKYKQVTEQASEDDRRWFERHPNATMRLRPYVFGEFLPGAHDSSLQYVLVRQIRPGVRQREPLEPDGPIFQYLRVDPETGEVLGKYSDAPTWGDEMARKVRDVVDPGDSGRDA